MNKIVIAIDGYSGCGKSTTARALAAALGYTYIDTGAMYRAVTLYFHQHHVTLSNEKEVRKALGSIEMSFHIDKESGKNEIFLNGLNVEDEIREMYIAEQVSLVSALHDVREAMVGQQRRMGKRKGIVMDGRDIGTVVFPDAELKIFMQADIYIRATRRQQELIEKGHLIDLQDVINNLEQRDHLDTTRAESPLRKAEDAIIIDTTFLTFDEQVDKVINLALSKKLEASPVTKNPL